MAISIRVIETFGQLRSIVVAKTFRIRNIQKNQMKLDTNLFRTINVKFTKTIEFCFSDSHWFLFFLLRSEFSFNCDSFALGNGISGAFLFAVATYFFFISVTIYFLFFFSEFASLRHEKKVVEVNSSQLSFRFWRSIKLKTKTCKMITNCRSNQIKCGIACDIVVSAEMFVVWSETPKYCVWCARIKVFFGIDWTLKRS